MGGLLLQYDLLFVAGLSSILLKVHMVNKVNLPSHTFENLLILNPSSQDCEDPNPLIRALAVRTMGCIRVDKITEYLCEPLRKCLKDEDPYVRKTAAVCVAKLHDINAQLVEDQGFLDTLKDLISDSNPMVRLPHSKADS